MNESDFQVLYDTTKDALRAYIYKMTGDSALADDIVQETYIRFLQAEHGALAPAQVKSYLYTIATNMVRDYWRKTKRKREWSEEISAEPLMKHDDFRFDVNDAFEKLSPQHKALLWLAYVDEYKHKEIAELLRLNEKSIRVLLFRAKQKFIEMLHTIGIRAENYDKNS